MMSGTRVVPEFNLLRIACGRYRETREGERERDRDGGWVGRLGWLQEFCLE